MGRGGQTPNAKGVNGEGLPEVTSFFDRTVRKVSTVIVKRHCLIFAISLAIYLLLAFLGGYFLWTYSQARGQPTVFTDATEFDWSVSGMDTVVQRDMVRTAYEALEDFRDEQDSESDDEVIQERSETADDKFMILLYFYAKTPTENLFNPKDLQAMCEFENVVLSRPDYGKVCYNASSTGVYTTDYETNCTLPSVSAVSLFYRQWDYTVEPVEVWRAGHAHLTTAKASLKGAIDSSGASPSWADAKTAVTTALAGLTDPGGAASEAYTPLKNAAAGFNAAAVNGVAADFEKTLEYVDLLHSIFGGVANLSDDEVRSAVLMAGASFLGVPDGAPDAADDADAMVEEGSHARRCQKLSDEYVESRAAQIFEMAHSSDALLAIAGNFLDVDSLAKNATNSTRSYISFGAPREAPYATDDEMEPWMFGLETRMQEEFAMQIGCLSTSPEFFCFSSPYRDPAEKGPMQVKFVTRLWLDAEFGRIVNHDFIMVVLSILFVWLYICFHTTSFALGSFAILQIILSIPVSLFFYTVVLQIPYFAQVHNLAIFIILGVGADDVFVFMDGWRQSASMPSLKTLVDRMELTYARTVTTVLNTSLTTAIAFFATASAPIMPIASFGVFAACMIILNYIMCITWWPAIVLIWELYFCRAKGVGCCFTCSGCPATPCAIADTTTHPSLDPDGPRATVRKAATAPATAPNGREAPTLTPVEPVGDAVDVGDSVHSTTSSKGGGGKAAEISSDLGCFERFFHVYYGPLITWQVGPYRACKPFSLFAVALMSGVGGYLASEALTLTTPDESPVWFPADHMWTGIFDQAREGFLAGDDAAYIPGNLYFGLGDIDAPDYSKWEPAENRGTVVWDNTFDLTDADAQAAILDACEALREEPCELAEVCTRPPGDLASLDSVQCFLEAFREYEGGSLPTGDAFNDAIKAWLDDDDSEDYRMDVGYLDGRVKFCRISFYYTALVGIPVRRVRELYDRAVVFLDTKVKPGAPKALGVRPLFDSGRLFSWMRTSETLVTVVLQGFAIIFPCAFAILFFSTGSVVVSVLATLTVVLITASLLGGVKVAFGFALGIGEAIAGNIVIGLSIDYTLHLSHAYMHADVPTREGKARHASTTMGVTVVAGAMTTFCSALFMLPCQLTFFTDMCTLIGGTVMFSILFALLFFMPLMALVGPEGDLSLSQFVRRLVTLRLVSPRNTDTADAAPTKAAAVMEA